jgi:dTDP-4-amino-4,6-dideoxygalactose transaminase
MNKDSIMKVSAGPEQQLQMVDLVAQYENISDEVDVAIARILKSAAFIGGAEVETFRNNLEAYLDVKHVIPCANGTDALQIALMALDLKQGDEIIVPAFTFIASVEVIALMGYTPVVCDVYPDTFNMNVEQLEACITPRTRAILPVHLFGQCSHMDVIQDIARVHDLYVVEDNAQSIGAHYNHSDGTRSAAGTIGTIGTTSFYPSKNLGCYGDGGAIFTNNKALGDYIRSIANHGMTKRYYHDHIGVNSRLDAIQAAVLNIKLQHVNTYHTARQSAAAQYDQLLGQIPDVEVPARSAFSTHVFHQYTIKVPAIHRDGLQDHLKAQGIPTMIYYPVPLQDQKAFEGIVKTPVPLDTTTLLCKTVLSLPMHSEMDASQTGYISEQIGRYFGA